MSRHQSSLRPGTALNFAICAAKKVTVGVVIMYLLKTTRAHVCVRAFTLVSDCARVVQIGLRGTGYSAEDFEWCRDQGFRVVQAEQCWHKSLVTLMAEVREQMGDGPVCEFVTSSL